MRKLIICYIDYDIDIMSIFMKIVILAMIVWYRYEY